MAMVRGYDGNRQPNAERRGDDDWQAAPPRNTQFGAVFEIVCGEVPMPEKSYGSALPFGQI